MYYLYCLYGLTNYGLATYSLATYDLGTLGCRVHYFEHPGCSGVGMRTMWCALDALGLACVLFGAL